MGRLRAKAGKVTVEYDDVLDRLYRAAAERLAPGLLDACERKMEAVRDAAASAWPVKTGRSRAGLEVVSSIDANSGRLTVQIRNDVVYAVYVPLSSTYGSSTAWQRLVRDPGRKATKELAAELGPVTLGILTKRGG